MPGRGGMRRMREIKKMADRTWGKGRPVSKDAIKEGAKRGKERYGYGEKGKKDG